MNAALISLMSRYTLTTSEEYLNALREVIQYISLLGLWRANFFERASFYGGTALRIFYGLSRYSEDMDFSLLFPRADFSMGSFAKSIEDELGAFGFSASVETKEKTFKSRVNSAFVKTDTLKSLLLVDAPARMTDRLHRDARLKVKLEIDTDPPPFAETEVRSLLVPIPFQVRIYSPSALFAGKIHALLCRSWKSRIKGRDFYDFIWFIGMEIPCDLKHLKARMVQSGNFGAEEVLDKTKLIAFLKKRFATIDFKQAVHDVLPFVTDPQSIKLWSEPFFNEVAERIKVKESPTATIIAAKGLGGRL